MSMTSPISSIPLGDIPPACAGNCTTQLTNFENCLNSVDTACLCSQSTEVAIFNCFLCLGNLDGNFTLSQQVINELVGVCDNIGSTLPVLAFPGQTSTAPQLPSSSPTGNPSPLPTLPQSSISSNGILSTPLVTMTLQQTNTQGSVASDTPQPTSGSSNNATPSSPAIMTHIQFIWIIISAFFMISLLK